MINNLTMLTLMVLLYIIGFWAGVAWEKNRDGK